MKKIDKIVNISSGIPLVSICIPTFNNANFISSTLDSIINQTYKNIEIIVVDNASTDNTKEIVESYSDKRISYHRNLETIHCLSNWNLCIELAQSDFVAIYHSDDIYEPSIIEKELGVLKNKPEIGAVFCLDNIIDENGRYVRPGAKYPSYLSKINSIGFEELFPLMLKEFPSFLIAPTFMARRNIFENVGLFNTKQFGASTGSAGDTDLWLRISQKHDIAIINERLIQRRVSIHQGSNLYSISKVTRANHFSVLDNILETQFPVERVVDNILRQYEFNKFIDDIIRSKNMIKQGDRQKARRLLVNTLSFMTLVTVFNNIPNLKFILKYIIHLLSTFFNFKKPHDK